MNIRRGTPGNPFRILLVEDNPGDVDLVIDAPQGVSASHQISVMPDGEARCHFCGHPARGCPGSGSHFSRP